jgi:hypothetical protein
VVNPEAASGALHLRLRWRCRSRYWRWNCALPGPRLDLCPSWDIHPGRKWIKSRRRGGR